MKAKRRPSANGKTIEPLVPIDVIRPPHPEGGSAETEMPVPDQPKDALIYKDGSRIPECDPPRD